MATSTKSNTTLPPAEQTSSRKRRERYPGYFWFNPPYSAGVKTPVAGDFLKIVDKHFGPGSPYHKYINRRTVKVSYCCCKNVASHIAQRNHRIMQEIDEDEKLCRCKDKTKCPLPNECLTEAVVYQSLIKSGTEKWNYFGETSQTFKARWAGHKSNIKNKDQAGTALSAKVWELKDAGRNYEIKNKIVRKAHPHKTGDSVCDLCLTEKTCIVLGHRAPPKLFVLHRVVAFWMFEMKYSATAHTN